MGPRWFFALAVLALAAFGAETDVPTPPMGWNSWDSYGLSVTEQEYLANARYMADNLKKFGWQYAVVDEGWYVGNPQEKPEKFELHLDSNGRYVPAENRFPSTAKGAGFHALAEQVHGQGLKFGIHILRGIPKQAVAKNLKIAGTDFSARDAADQSDTCAWNTDNYGIKNNAAGQAYYDSIAKLYAGWGVDFVKIDCISANPYKGDEIRMFSQALQKTGRTIILSLSPGPAPISKAGELKKWSDMWRISNDVWDVWKLDTNKPFPQDVQGQFQKTAAWEEYVGEGNWPDADMLPLGHIGPRPGEGKDRDSRLTHDEQKSLFTLWCIFRSPLIMGGNLTQLDPWTKGLLTNDEVLAVNQKSTGGKQVIAGGNAVVWVARGENGTHDIAVFNMGEDTRDLAWTWHQAGLAEGRHAVRNLWTHKDLGAAEKLSVRLNTHEVALLRVTD